MHCSQKEQRDENLLTEYERRKVAHISQPRKTIKPHGGQIYAQKGVFGISSICNPCVEASALPPHTELLCFVILKRNKLLLWETTIDYASIRFNNEIKDVTNK